MVTGIKPLLSVVCRSLGIRQASTSAIISGEHYRKLAATLQSCNVWEGEKNLNRHWILRSKPIGGIWSWGFAAYRDQHNCRLLVDAKSCTVKSEFVHSSRQLSNLQRMKSLKATPHSQNTPRLTINHVRAGHGICAIRKTPETVDRSISDDQLRGENPIITKYSRKLHKIW